LDRTHAEPAFSRLAQRLSRVSVYREAIVVDADWSNPLRDKASILACPHHLGIDRLRGRHRPHEPVNATTIAIDGIGQLTDEFRL